MTPCSTTAQLSRAARAGSPIRAAVSICAALIVLLTVLQPLLCAIHCSFTAQAAEQSARPHTADGPFLCHVGAPAGAEAQLIPAFWPAALPASLALVIAALLVLQLAPAEPPRPRARRWAPPIPPPRAA